EAARYILRSWAWGFQNPGKPAEAAGVLRGKEGCGKGVLLRAVRGVYGSHGYQGSQPRHLTGNFNSHMWTCCFLFADEAVWAGNKEHEGILKALITEDTIMIEKKRIDPFKSKNMIKLWMATNNDWAVPVGPEARRFTVLDCNNQYAEDQ